MRPIRASVLLCLALSACGVLEKLGIGGDPGADAVASAKQTLVAGDLPAGATALQAAFTDNPGSVDAAVAAAYGAFLEGNLDGAESILAGAMALDEARKGELLLRRALVALAAGDLDQVRSHGEASGLPGGQLLAAEVALADGERDAATALLQSAKGGGDRGVSGTAADYLALMADADPRVQGLSEAQALWALGERRVAVRSVEELVKSLPDDRDDKSELLLIWAGRAAAAGEAQVASNLVESVDFPPAGQQWRVIATRAIVACAEGDADRCGSLLDTIEKGAPPAGLADARATAAILLARKDPSAAPEIAGDGASPAVARALLAAGQGAEAADLVSSGPFARYLTSEGGG